MNSFLRYLFFFFCFLPFFALANDPCSAIPVPNNGVLFNVYNLSSQTGSGVEAPTCGAYNDPDIWFSFVAPIGGSVTIEVKGVTAADPAMAVYSGPCAAAVLEGCYDDQQCGNIPNPGVSLTGLTVGSTYFIRVWNELPGGGTFKMRILNLNQSNFTNQFNAFNTGPNCVQLTSATGSQKGCSWYNAPLDFDEYFELEFNLYFGNSDAGADGICLVFSTSQACGLIGGGIGAAGIPNSVIIEFDTWDNGMSGYDDIPEDHTSIHLNGDFSSSIAGPVGYPNIEDGQSHPAFINWDPSTMTLTVSLDGVEILQMIGFDAVNLAFGGNSEVFWGWTASTGGAFNQQSFCFESNIDNTAAINEILDISICEGESYTSPNGNTYSTEGIYEENFIAGNGCNSLRTINLTVIPVPIKILNPVICADDVYVLNGMTYNTAGQYTVTLPGMPCDTIAELTLAIIDFDIQIIKSNDLNCNNSFAVLQAILTDNSSNPFTGNFDYYWTTNDGEIINGQGTDQILVDKAGSYQLLVYALDNSTTCLFPSLPMDVIDQSIPPLAIITQLSPLDCLNAQAVLDGSYSNPGPLQYEWYTTNGNIVGTNIGNVILIDSEGEYSLIVENIVTGCKDTTSYTVIKTSFNATAVLQKSSDLDCLNTTIDIIATVTNGSGLNALWTTLDGYILSDPAKVAIQITEPGTYTFTLSDNSGCTQSYSILINENIIKPNVDAGLDQVIDCINNSATLIGNVTSPDANFEMLWSSPDATVINPGNASINITEAGMYIFTTIDTSNHCSKSDTVIVSASLETPVLNVIDPGKITCDKPLLKLIIDVPNYDSGFIYEWSTQDGVFTGLPSDTFIIANTTGTYHLLVTNPGNGCSDTIQYIISGSADKPIADAGPDITLDCIATSTTIAGNYTSIDPASAINIEWTTSNGTITGNTNQLSVTVGAIGQYILTISNLINDCVSTDTLDVFQSIDKPIIVVPDSYKITCDQIIETIIPTWTNAGSNPMVTWSTDDGNIVNIDQDSIVNVNEEGTYVLTVVNVSNNCLSTYNVIVIEDIVPPAGTIQDPELLTCSLLSVDVIFSGGQPNYVYYWSTLDGNITSAATAPLIKVSKAGTYDLLITDPDNGCSQILSKEVMVSDDVPLVNAGTTGVLNCKISDLILNGFVGNVNNYTSSWQAINGGNILSGASTLQPRINNSGIYILTVTNLTNSCVATDTVEVIRTITTPQFLNPIITDANCFGMNGIIQFDSIINGDGPYIFKVNGQISNNNSLNFDQLDAGTYQIIAEDINGCLVEFETTISTKGAISFILPDSISVEFGQSYRIIPEFLFDTVGMHFQPWVGADYLDCNLCLYPTARPTYNATLTLSVTDFQGCPAEESIEIRVFKKAVNVFIPNIFSPGDHNGINDNITVFTDPNVVPLIDEFRIFDRWGAEVFSRINFIPNDEKEGWNGYFKGKLANPAVYVYYVKCKNIYGEQMLLKGGITLVQ